LIEHIKKLARAQDPATKRDLFRSLRLELADLLKDPNEGLVLKYYNVMAWVESNERGVPFSEVVRGMGKAK